MWIIRSEIFGHGIKKRGCTKPQPRFFNTSLLHVKVML